MVSTLKKEMDAGFILCGVCILLSTLIQRLELGGPEETGVQKSQNCKKKCPVPNANQTKKSIFLMNNSELAANFQPVFRSNWNPTRKKVRCHHRQVIQQLFSILNFPARRSLSDALIRTASHLPHIKPLFCLCPFLPNLLVLRWTRL